MSGGNERRRVAIDLGERSYTIEIGHGILPRLGELRRSSWGDRPVAIITDGHVGPLYAAKTKEVLEREGPEPLVAQIPPGEVSKSFARAEELCDRLARGGLDRHGIVVALGGGVVGDLAGFVAAVFMRGVDYVQAPTSLLAAVDSSVGGKVAVNLPTGKNLAGAFHQPRNVVADVGTLATLPAREWGSGSAEVIKYGAILDEAFFSDLEKLPNGLSRAGSGELMRVIGRCCELKAEIVAEDEREQGRRSILNFGHTVGHALEAVSGYGRLLHGEAVAIGMCCESELGARLGLTPPETVGRLRSLIEAWGLPSRIPPGPDDAELLEAMGRDKKTVGGILRCALLENLGRCRTASEVPAEAVQEVLRVCRQ
jgi:3-dehydroquinate synthase